MIQGKEGERDRRGETAGKEPQGLGGGTTCKGKHESPAGAGCQVQTATETTEVHLSAQMQGLLGAAEPQERRHEAQPRAADNT